MKRYIMAIGDGPFSGTGFGEELRHVLFRLTQTGDFDISWQSLQHQGYTIDITDTMFPDIPHKGAKIRLYGNHGDPFSYGADAFLKNYRDINPEMVFFMGDPRNIIPYQQYKVKLGFPFVFYVTLDGLPIHPQWLDSLKYVNLLVAMTNWGAEEYFKAGFHPAWIHHGLNWEWWQITQQKKLEVRQKYNIPDDVTVFVNWDVPQHRKRTDALIRCWRDFHPEKKKAILMLYSDWDLGGSLGYNVEGLIKQYNAPRDTIVGPIEIQGVPKYWNCPETPEKLRDIVCAGDVYISTTSGEGFGKCGLEAMGMGMPVVITDYAASTEVHRKGSMLVPCYAGRQGRFRLDDRRRSVEAGVVDEEKFVASMQYLYQRNKERIFLGDEAKSWARQFDYDKKIVPQWKQLLGTLDTDLIAAKELLNI